MFVRVVKMQGECACVCVPGRKAGGCPRTPAANNSTASESAVAAEGEHKHNISPDRYKKSLFMNFRHIVFKASI